MSMQRMQIKSIFTAVSFVLAIMMSFMTNAQAAQQQSWNSWLADLKKDAVAQGINPRLFDEVFKGVRPQRRVLNLDKRQPEHRLTFMKYRRTRIDPYRITLGRREMKKYHNMLSEIGSHYGVDPCFIVSFWGIESSYGRFMGSFPTIRALATLAYDSRRGDYFRKELLYALHILNDGHITNDKYKGEWAGASGQPQFMPSSWSKYAVDYNGDGKKDIWSTHADIFASIANYIKSYGWRKGQPWAIPVKLPYGFDKDLMGKDVKKSVSDWLRLGVKPEKGFDVPNSNLEASIIRPYGGPDFMIFHNFYVIKKYNNSDYYALSVGYMADKICRRQ